MRGRGGMHGGVPGGGACMAGGCAWREGEGGMYVGETVTEAGGTHPTRMHSCFVFIIMVQSKYVFIESRLLLLLKVFSKIMKLFTFR